MSTSTALHYNELILVGQFGDLCCTDGIIGTVDGDRNMSYGKLNGTAYVENNITGLLRHQGNRIVHGDLVVVLV